MRSLCVDDARHICSVWCGERRAGSLRVFADEREEFLLVFGVFGYAGAVGEPRDNRNLLDLEKLFPEGNSDGFSAVDGT